MTLANKDISKIKMVVLTDSGQSNIVWYSPIKQNKKDDSFIIEGMLRRFFNHSSSKHARIVQFYSTKTDILIKEIRKTAKNEDTTQSKKQERTR